jgi:hypothetical protein
VLDHATALRDILFERQHLSAGHLGGGAGWRYNAGALVSLGPVGLLLLVLSPLLLRDARLRALVIPAMVAWVLLVVPAVAVRLDAERYLAPSVPIAAFLIAMTATAAWSRARGRQRRRDRGRACRVPCAADKLNHMCART